MRLSPRTIRGWMFVAALLVCPSLLASAQNSADRSSSSQSLGDAARKARKEHETAGHVAARQLVDEEEDGPDTTGVWRVRLCSRTPCYELSIALPRIPKWARGTAEPRPVLIPLPGAEEDANGAIRIYAAESLGPTYTQVDGARRVFLQGWFSRPEYFGQGARLLRDEHIQIDGTYATITHFTVIGGTIKYRGLSVVAGSPNGNYGFACVFREEDSSAAASVCEAIVKSARSQALEPAKPLLYPTYQDPLPYNPNDPPEDPPDSDDPPNTVGCR